MFQELSNMNSVEAADFLGRSVQTLANWRYRMVGPPYIKINGRIIYRFRDLKNFLEQNRIDPMVNSK